MLLNHQIEIIFSQIYFTFNCMGCQVDAINTCVHYQDDHTLSHVLDKNFTNSTKSISFNIYVVF